MPTKRKGYKQKVLKVFPNAMSIYYAGEWHIYSGDSETGDTCIGSGGSSKQAWEDAELNSCDDIGERT